MEKLGKKIATIIWNGFIFGGLGFSSAQAVTLKFEKLDRVVLSEKKFKKTKIGGLSALSISNNKIYALSDDRGRVNRPRMYVFNLNIEKDRIEIHPEKVIFINSHENQEDIYLDGEGLIPLPGGNWLVSCEGDNNHKPRRPPRLVEINPEGQWQKNWKIPDFLVPENAGLQTRGILNNSGMEGLAINEDQSRVVAIVERPLQQDLNEVAPAGFLRVLEFRKIESPKGENKILENFEIYQNYFYPLAAPVGQVPTIFPGASEILQWKDQIFLVLERGLRMEIGSKPKYMANIFSINLSEAETVNETKNLRKEKQFFLRKNLALSLDVEDTENFEGLAWGPAWKGYSRTLWIMNDNNFSKKEENVFLVYGVKESF